ncbi:MAG: serine/threonine-protein kinase [bacterium]
MDPDATFDPTPPAADPEGMPARIGPYRVDGLLGRGGMGEVYRGFDEALQQPVAIKRVAGRLRGQAEARARFWREARALATLDHPGVVRVHRIDESAEGELFLAMELVDGPPLAELAGRPWPAPFAAAVGRQAAAALGAVHRAGMTHRDVKPANLLVQADGTVRVVDFGLARRPELLEERVTATGARVGTPAYMAPEQVEGAAVGPAADVFSLGVVLYRLVAGTHPFARDSEGATALALSAAAHTPLGAAVPEADPGLVAVVERCLARDPAGATATGRPWRWRWRRCPPWIRPRWRPSWRIRIAPRPCSLRRRPRSRPSRWGPCGDGPWGATP